MHLSVNNREIRHSILSKREILGIIMVFSFVLYLLFPKENIDQILEGKGKNTKLSINYLESMLLYYPNNIKIKMLLIENYIYAQKNIKALELANQLIATTKDRELLKELYKTQYVLMKDLYFETDNQYLLKGVKEKLYKYFLFMEGERDYTFFFVESAQLDFQKLKYVSMRGFLKERPEMVTYPLERDAFRQALALGLKDDAYEYLLNLLNYKEVEREIENYALSLMLEKQEYQEVERLATKLFLKSTLYEEQVRYFNIALEAIINEGGSDYKERIGALITLYESNIPLKSSDIIFLIKALLQIGDIKKASAFATVAFKEHQGAFTQKVCREAIKALIYNQQLASALEIALFAKDKYKSIEWLDKSIQLSLWQGKMQEIVKLNIEGYRHYDNPKYEKYLLKSCNMNRAYGILGEIYSNKLEQGDYTAIKKVAEYYEYTGEIAKGEEYFTQLLTKHPHPEIHKQAILFAYKNSQYKRGLRLYTSFREHYGIDKELQEQSVQKLIALKRFKEAYTFAKALKKEDKRLTDLGWLQKDYKFIQKTLWKKEKSNKLAYGQYNKLIRLEEALNHGQRLEYLYKKLWKNTKKRVYLTALFYLYLEKNNLKAITMLLATLNTKERLYFENNVYYQVAMANFFIKQKNIPLAVGAFRKALDINPKDASTHQAYLWFLLDNGLTLPLKKELKLLKTEHKLQQEVAFPSVITAMKFGQGDLALRWLKPLLKESSPIEYQVVYADLLELHDQKEGAKSVRLKLFKRLNKQIKENPKLLKNKTFAKVYLGLVMRYVTPYAKKALYFEKFKSLFSQEEFLELKLGEYSFRGNKNMVRYIANKNQLNIPWVNLYLALNLDDKQKKQEVLAHNSDTLSFRDKIRATLDIGDQAGAYSLIFQGLEDNRRDMELFSLYHEMINSNYPNASHALAYKHLTPQLSAIEQKINYRWRLYKGIESKVGLNYYEYFRKNRADIKAHTLFLALKNSSDNFLWNFSVEQHHSSRDFTSLSLDMNYHLNPFDIEVKSQYHTKTTQTPELQSMGMESSLAISLRTQLSQRTQLNTSYKESHFYHQNRDKIGSGKQLHIGANYLLRLGYPDIRFNTYLSQNSYKSSMAERFFPKSFTEFGTQLSVGDASKYTLHTSWKPFGTVGFAINNHQNIGSSLSVGLVGMLQGGDSLELMFDYSKGLDAITTPYYGFHLNYKF